MLALNRARVLRGGGLVALLCCFVLLLAGCTPLGVQNINELLRAPALGEGQGEVQKALELELGDGVEYKFPKEGDERSPILMADLDGDGTREALLLYSIPAGTVTDHSSNVYVAVMKRQGDEWKLVQRIEGAGSEVASLEAADLLGDGTTQVLVGYAPANFTSRFLAVYQWQDGKLRLASERTTTYSRYELADFTGRGGKDLIIVSADNQLSGLLLQHVPVVDGQLDYSKETVALGTGMKVQSCAGMYPSVNAEGEHLIVVDMITENDLLVSQFIYYWGEQFVGQPNPEAFLGNTGRMNPLLKSQDIDGDDIVEIPQRVGNEKVITLNGDKDLEFVKWMDFTPAEPLRKEFGILDSDRGVYIRLPHAWLDSENGVDTLSVKVQDGAGEGEWFLEDIASRKQLLSLRIFEPGTDPPMGAVQVSQISNAWLVLSPTLSGSEERAVGIISLN